MSCPLDYRCSQPSHKIRQFPIFCQCSPCFHSQPGRKLVLKQGMHFRFVWPSALPTGRGLANGPGVPGAHPKCKSCQFDAALHSAPARVLFLFRPKNHGQLPANQASGCTRRNQSGRRRSAGLGADGRLHFPRTKIRRLGRQQRH